MPRRAILVSLTSVTLFLTTFLNVVRAEELSYFLPDDVTYDPAIPTPAAYLGFELGEWHARPDQITGYFREIARISDRVQVETYGYSHERHPLILATISSTQNMQRIDELRRAHLDGVYGRNDAKRPVVAWMGYGVHGNEPSASNAALLVLYHWAAAQGKAIQNQLSQSIILIDACLNPDGNARFAQWVNSHKGDQLVKDARHREHREAWPGGRTNHYWFDLNRDWLLLTHPESRSRLAQFHRWKPNVLTDYHEMGSSSSYFFQPGIPSRQNPYTPDQNLDLTRQIATYNAAALDEIGAVYYSEESFDDFYYGKGSTYPDVNGCIGILFEQASARGHLQENSYGLLSFPFAIRNQFRTSLGTLKAAFEMRESLQSYQREFYKSPAEKVEGIAGYVVGIPDDPARLEILSDLLSRHEIRVERLKAPLQVGGVEYAPESSYVVRLAQPQWRLIRSVFDRTTNFRDNSFYDVSAWNFADSFGASFAALQTLPTTEEGRRLKPKRDKLVENVETIAYLMPWDSYFAPRTLAQLLANDIKCRVATKALTVENEGTSLALDPGTIVITLGNQPKKAKLILRLLNQGLARDSIKVYPVNSAQTRSGLDLGSPSVRSIEPPRPLMLVGRGTSAYECGEIWHLLDKRIGMPLTMVESRNFSPEDLSDYTHLILVQGASGGFDEETSQEIEEWVRGGGILIAQKSSVSWATRSLLGDSMKVPAAEAPEKNHRYADYDEVRAVERIGGAIFEVELDRSHPIAFGFTRDRLSVFRNSTLFLPDEANPFTDVARYTEDPLLAGYASKRNQDALRRGLAVAANILGRGTVIRLVDNPNFRGVWYGTNRLFMNSLFFGGVIRSTPATDYAPKGK